MVDCCVNSFGKPFLWGILAQLIAVTLAAFGCAGVLWSEKKKWPRWCGIGLPFGIAYIVAIWGLIEYIEASKPVEKDTYMFFVCLFLYIDTIMLSIMVAFSGGVKRSLFTPLFFAIPAMAVVFIPRCTVSWLELSPIWWITIATLVGYLFVYLLLHLLVHRFPDLESRLYLTLPEKKPKLFYGTCDCIVLASSVFLTVYMSLKIPPLLEKIAQFGFFTCDFSGVAIV